MIYKNHNSEKKNVVPFQNGCQITDFFFRVISILAKIGKNTFPKEFFNEFWLIVRQHRILYIYIGEIKIGNYHSPVILGAKQFFSVRPKMLIYSN